MQNTCYDNRWYWDTIAETYQGTTRIATDDLHFGPLLPGDRELGVFPEVVAGLECLELGCGGAQNSIALARRGARCTALDVSGRQLTAAAELAAAADVEISLVQGSISDLPLRRDCTFDIVHSVYALPFVDDQAAVIRDAAARVRPGGQLILSTAHPVFSGEWLEVEDEGCGMFVSNYHMPPADVRFSEDGELLISSQPLAVSDVLNAVIATGLCVERVLEPAALPIPTLTDAEVRARVPYDSEHWRELYSQLAAVPVVLVVRAARPQS
jgi:SAM-dependent methyltransferase